MKTIVENAVIISNLVEKTGEEVTIPKIQRYCRVGYFEATQIFGQIEIDKNMPTKKPKKVAAKKKAGEKPKKPTPPATVKNQEVIAPMTKEETARRTQLEDIISRGISMFRDVGEALMEIQSKKLYRNDYATFEEYCSAEWKFGPAYGYRLINASQVTAKLEKAGLPAPASERAAREIAAVPPEHQEKVYQDAMKASDGEAPTAEAIKKAASSVKKAKPAKAAPAGLSKEDIAENEKLASALDKVGKVLGPEFVKAVKAGTLDIKKPDLLAMSEMKADQLKALSPLMVELRWTFKKASAFLSEMVNENSTVTDLIHHAIAGGGSLSATVGGWNIAVSKKRK